MSRCRAFPIIRSVAKSASNIHPSVWLTAYEDGTYSNWYCSRFSLDSLFTDCSAYHSRLLLLCKDKHYFNTKFKIHDFYFRKAHNTTRQTKIAQPQGYAIIYMAPLCYSIGKIGWPNRCISDGRLYSNLPSLLLSCASNLPRTLQPK